MTDAPLHIRLVKHELVRGTLADGSPAVLQRVDVSHRETSQRFYQAVLVCTMPRKDTMGYAVACGAIKYECPADGCNNASLVKGIVRVGDERIEVKETAD